MKFYVDFFFVYVKVTNPRFFSMSHTGVTRVMEAHTVCL